MKKATLFILLISILSCSKKQDGVYEIPVKEMTDTEYPDNPNLESRHSAAKQQYFSTILLKDKGSNLFDLDLISQEDSLCKITLNNLPLLEMMPTAPDWIKKDEYLTYIGVINQEWNRQQVQFNTKQFSVSGKSGMQITRVDLARNCLNSYLWEMLVYAKDTDGKDKLFWQCWFNFPNDLYAEMFETRNQLSFDTFRKGMENWIDPPSKLIDLQKIRQVKSEKEVEFVVKNQEMYPLNGERLRKRKNIVCPKVVNKMDDLLNDSTTFATFSIPGFYNTKDPRKTELSRLGILQKVNKRQIINALGKESEELEFIFLSNKDPKTITKFIIGGMDMSLIPTLPIDIANDGWQTSMGIANHSFYETFDFQQKHLTKDNGFYAFLLDDKNNWLDSHKVGIDGPLFHFDEKDKTKLHCWILSFERHAFVGHFVINL